MRIVVTLTVLLVALASGTTDGAQDAAVCNLACVKGKTCKLQQVQCITTPCNPVPTCVPVETEPPEPVCTKKCSKDEKCMINSADNSQYCLTPCATVRCSSGYTCQVEQVQCIRAPCPPVAVCKPVKTPCPQRVLRTTSNM
ncbi:hypothetical protein KRP22_005254 [Phytophthora ramorum]|nr:hypothetical protein KRP22_12838 [Phytophthora ramorum]